MTTESLAVDVKPSTFDAIIVGTGQAGPALAGRLTSAGMTVAIVERGLVGGTCVNVGCTPTKTMVASAYVAHLASRSADFGVRFQEPPRIDMAAVSARVESIVQSHRVGLERSLSEMPGCSLIRGHARFVSPHQLRVGDQLLRAEKVFLNVGSRASIPQLPGLDTVPYWTNSDVVALQEVPRKLVIVGGSYIGLEFAQIFRRLGAEVTVIERGLRVAPREDVEVSEQIRAVLEREGIKFRLGSECIHLHAHPQGIAVGVTCTSAEPHEIGSHLLLAVGRRPNTDDLGLNAAGIAVDAAGYIVVDDQLRTNIDGVWALGDCNGSGAFTHTAYNDFEIVAANLLDGESRLLSDRIPVYGLFIDPPLGRVGLTEAEARATGRNVLVGMRPMTRVARAVEKGESQGSMKVIVDADTKQILGASVFGPGGDEAVHAVLATMSACAPYTQLKNTMAIHPTVSELIPTILGELS